MVDVVVVVAAVAADISLGICGCVGVVGGSCILFNYFCVFVYNIYI